MNKTRVLAVTALLLAGAAVAAAQTSNLPAGLTQNGSVIMMQPIQDYEGADNGLQVSAERHAGRIHYFTGADHDLYARAFEAADHGDWLGARALAAQGHDSAAKRLIDWRYLLDKNSGASFDEINAFAKANPDWPMRDTLYARAEAVIDLNMTPAQVVAWFGSRAPVSGLGKVRLGEALIATGKTAQGREMIRDAWIKNSFEPDQELAIVQKDGSLLSPDIDRQRLNNLLWRDDAGGARRELARVTSEAQQVASARLMLRSSPAAGENMAQSLSAGDPDLLFDRARAARKAQNYTVGQSLLLRYLNATSDRSHSAKIWLEANILAREALKSQDYRTAYRLLDATNFQPGGDEFSESEFMAGWVALRFLKDAKAAQPHFRKLEAGVSRPISLARAHYWQGRAYEALGDTANAWEQYNLAAKQSTTFYGQVALAKIEAVPVLHVPDQALDLSGRAEFEQEDLIHAMKVLADLGQVSLLRTFALRYADLHPDARHTALLCQVLTDMGFREVSVRVAKQASYAGILYLPFTHPVIPVPPYPGSGTGPENAVVLGLIRQETEFDPAAVSAPGARGIMQIMPATAKHTAAVAGIPYRPNDLISDPAYNMQLGMTEFGGNLNDWSGSLVIAAAAYNAGPSNARKWLNNNGDPRSPASDPIDWIELIPFNETRNYVMRVLENTQIYRNRIAGRDQPLRIMADLYMPNPPPVKVINYTPPPAAQVPVPTPKPKTSG
ncbi:MAG: lytic transglycosylase domain-containing protein [Alphaproteobacteria bacterium]|nr:lytic transglycosylase domain-containing protein [Alphaproteobacteria bacterium]